MCGGSPVSISYSTDPERVDVRARGDLLLGRRLLGAHVVRRAEREAGLGHPTAGRRAHRERDPEVGHHRVPAVQQDVLRLDVAVDDAVLVRVVERVDHFARDAHRLVDAELRLAIELLAQRLALDVGHDVEQESVGRAGIEQRQDVRMLQRRRRLDLLHEPLGAEHRGELGLEELERDLAIVLQVGAQIHRRHAALTEMALDAVAAREGRVQAVGLLGHEGWAGVEEPNVSDRPPVQPPISRRCGCVACLSPR